MKDRKELIVILPFFGIIFIFLIMNFFVEDIDYSKEESRTLKTIENLSFDNLEILSGNIEDYVVDQFPGRSEFVKFYSEKDKLLGKIFSRDVYISDDNWIFVESGENEMEFIPTNLGKILDDYPDKSFYYAILPTKNVALKDKYAFTGNTVALKNYKKIKENLLNLNRDNLGIIDLIPEARSKTFLNDESKWYRTDFHWNASGAKSAIDFILQELNEKGEIEYVPKEEDVWIEHLNEKLYIGDLNKRFSYIYGVDEIPLILKGKNEDLYKYYKSEDDSIPVKRETIISSNIKEDTVDYAGIYTMNLDYYRIRNEEALNDKSILIIKDSMQNATTDIFSETFYETKIVDPRLKQKYSIEEIIKNVDIVLFMYHQSNDSEDGGRYLRTRKDSKTN